MCMESSKALEQNRGFIQHSVDSNDGKRLVELLSLFLSLSSCECSTLEASVFGGPQHTAEVSV